MNAVLKWVLRIVLMLILAAAVVGFWKREELQRLLAVNSLFSEEKIVHNFSHMSDAFLTMDLPRGNGPTWELPYGPEFDLPNGTDQWIEDRAVTSLLVMQDGQIRFEDYYLGTDPDIAGYRGRLPKAICRPCSVSFWPRVRSRHWMTR